MINYILVFIIILLLVPYLVDFYVKGLDFFKRLKIGRYKDLMFWQKKVENKCFKWINKTPTIKKTDNSSMILFDMLKGNYKSNTIQSWQTGMIFIALSENKKKNFVDLFIDSKGGWINKPTEVDYALIAYGCLKNSKRELDIKKAMDEMYKLILENYQDNDKCVAYRKGIPSIRFVDTVGFVSAFLALYGKVYNNEEAVMLSKHTIIEYYNKGFHKEMLLPIHAYDSQNNNPLGIFGWGRGTGWFLLGLIDTYLVTEDDDLKDIIETIAIKYKIYQKDDGSFSSNMQLKDSSESSITSVCAYFYANCFQIFHNEDYYVISRRCLEYLMTVTRRNGEIDFSQGDTKGIGYYSLNSNIMPFTQGMALRAYYTLNKQGEYHE